jgi:hypothetical protein
MLQLVFVIFSVQWKGGSNESPLASYQRVVFRAHQGSPAFKGQMVSRDICSVVSGVLRVGSAMASTMLAVLSASVVKTC